MALRSAMGKLYKPVLTPTQLDALRNYKYKGIDRSLTYRYLMAPMYTRLIEYFPLWIAPNVITLVGFTLPILSHLLLLYHTPTLQEDAPRWTYAVASASLFTYMVMDNLDGKQARRTNCSSPLGHLFDHGCDALNVTISGVALLACVRLSPPVMPMTLLFCLGHLMFFTSTLEEYHTGYLVLRELNGPNEGLLTLCLMQIATAVFGPDLWNMTITPSLPPLRVLMYILSVMPTLHAVVGNFCGMFSHAFGARRERLGVKDLRVACAPMVNTLPVLLAGAMQTVTAKLSPDLTRVLIVPLLWQMGLVTFDAVVRIMLATLTHSPYPKVFPIYIPFVLAYGVVLAAGVWDQLLHRVFVFAVVWGCASVSGVYCAWRSCCIINQICHFLNIRCFSIHPLREHDS